MLKNYLSERKQWVSFSDVDKIYMCSIICGVLQGCILGPLLFLNHVDDICMAFTILKLVMFTDDTKLFLTNKDINKLFNDANVEIQKLLIWFKANKLSLNLIKKKLTLFLSSKKKQQKNISLRMICPDLATIFWNWKRKCN